LAGSRTSWHRPLALASRLRPGHRRQSPGASAPTRLHRARSAASRRGYLETDSRAVRAGHHGPVITKHSDLAAGDLSVEGG
jgi:hypothetical protein